MKDGKNSGICNKPWRELWTQGEPRPNGSISRERPQERVPGSVSERGRFEKVLCLLARAGYLALLSECASKK